MDGGGHPGAHQWDRAGQAARGLSAILNPGNVKAVVEADAIDPLDLAARIPAGTPVLLTCSDSDAQASCAGMRPLADALAHTALQYVAFRGSTTCCATTRPTTSPTMPRTIRCHRS